LLAGGVGAVVQLVLSIPIGIVIAPFQAAMVERALSMAGTIPPEVREVLENYPSQRAGLGVLGMVVVQVIGFFFFLVIGAIFSTIGGLLGAAIFKKETPPGTLDATSF